MNKKLYKNLLIFSDGSFSLGFNKYTNKKIKFLNKDFKQNQLNNKQQPSNNFQDIFDVNNYRKNLFK